MHPANQQLMLILSNIQKEGFVVTTSNVWLAIIIVENLQTLLHSILHSLKFPIVCLQKVFHVISDLSVFISLFQTGNTMNLYNIKKMVCVCTSQFLLDIIIVYNSLAIMLHFLGNLN